VALLAYVLVFQMLAVGIAQVRHLGNQRDPAAAFDPFSARCMPRTASTDLNGDDPTKPAPERAPHDICCTLPFRLDAVLPPPVLIHFADWTRTVVQILRPMVGLDANSPSCRLTRSQWLRSRNGLPCRPVDRPPCQLSCLKNHRRRQNRCRALPRWLPLPKRLGLRHLSRRPAPKRSHVQGPWWPVHRKCSAPNAARSLGRRSGKRVRRPRERSRRARPECP
jgi:hypothetical protein